MRILFAGHQKWACLTLERLVLDGHTIVGVITEKDEFDKQGYKDFAEFGCYASLKEIATSLGLEVYQPDDINSPDFLKVIEEMRPEIIVIVSYHGIIRKQLLEKYKIINAHGALLPFYRGRAPINWAIINGEKYTGVTVHFVDSGIDTGDIILQETMTIGPDDTAIEVLKKTLPIYPRLVSDALHLIESGKVKSTKQSMFEGSYFPKRTEKDGRIDWNRTSVDIYNFIRALARPYPGAFTYIDGKKLCILGASNPRRNKTRISQVPGLVFGVSEGGSMKVSTADSYIEIIRVQFEGEPEKYAKDAIKIGSKFE
jgi:methionyl-tRNA formyltransferase